MVSASQEGWRRECARPCVSLDFSAFVGYSFSSACFAPTRFSFRSSLSVSFGSTEILYFHGAALAVNTGTIGLGVAVRPRDTGHRGNLVHGSAG